jgi:tetratricopeptide (TPR) repeat protein
MAMRAKTGIQFALLFWLAAGSAWPEAERVYQLVGKVVRSDGKPYRGRRPVIYLQSARTPFNASTLAEIDGSYKFKKLLPGIYTLTVAIPLTGEVTRTIEISPSFADAKARVTLNLTFDAKPDLAAKTISAAALGISAAAKTEYRKAQDCLARHDTAGAVAHLKKAVELAPQFSMALNNLGTIAYQARNYEEAANYFRQALEQEPGDYSPLVNLGGALLSSGKLKESLNYNLRAVKARPEDALAHAQLGNNYFYLGQLDMAEVELKRAKSLDPAHFSYPQLLLAEIYVQKRDPASAVLELEEFLKLHPDSERASHVRKVMLNLQVKRTPAAGGTTEEPVTKAGCRTARTAKTSEE